MIKVKNIIKTNKNKRFIKVITSIINHLGKNPKKGGRPPKDNKVMNILDFISLLFVYILKVWLMLKSLKLFKTKIMLNLNKT